MVDGDPKKYLSVYLFVCVCVGTRHEKFMDWDTHPYTKKKTTTNRRGKRKLQHFYVVRF